MPFINAISSRERDTVVPHGASTSHLFVSLWKTPRDTIFTTEHLIVTRYEAVYTLL